MDAGWFQARIAERFGNQANFACKIKGFNGKPLAQSAISRTLSGVREFQVWEIRQWAKLLQVSPIEILIRAGIVTEREVGEWVKSLE